MSNSIDCTGMLNPLDLTIQSVQDGGDQESDESISNNGKRRRRRSISPLKRKKRDISKRQELAAVDEVVDVSVVSIQPIIVLLTINHCGGHHCLIAQRKKCPHFIGSFVYL